MSENYEPVRECISLLNNVHMLQTIRGAVAEASVEVLRTYLAGDLKVSIKEDATLVTEADRFVHHYLENSLARLTPHIPVVSEERPRNGEPNNQSNLFWLMDPLDGTVEFVRKCGEFTVNLALICEGQCRFGFVCAPLCGKLFFGGPNFGAWWIDLQQPSSIQALPMESRCTDNHETEKLRVLVSQSHLDDKTRALVKLLGNDVTLIRRSSSFKFIMIANGEADIYPRLAPTYEWDTAAAHAILIGAGGDVRQLDGSSLVYGKADFLNPYFIAYRQKAHFNMCQPLATGLV